MKQEKQPVVVNLRTTKEVKEAAQKLAAETDRSLNYTLNAALRRAFGLDKAA